MCKGCGAPIRYVVLAGSGDAHPVDPKPQPVPAVGMLAFNPGSQCAVILKAADVATAARWQAHGAMVYRSHFSTCRDAARFRVSQQQETLDV